MGTTRGKYTGEKANARRIGQAARQAHIEALRKGEGVEELPEPLFPEVFEEIREIYWERLKSVPDPRSPTNRVYPLYPILHRIVAGFTGGNRYVGVLFPKKRRYAESGKRKLGALPTRKAVYTLLRRIDWAEANAILSPLWLRLGFAPDLVVRRKFRNPKAVLGEFREERKRAERERREKLAAGREAEERSKGMSAAEAKQSRIGKTEPVDSHKIPEKAKDGKAESKPVESIKIHHDLAVDGKVVKSSYNSGTTERFVHVTEIKVDDRDDRSRFIIGARPTELDGNGEWGAALSVLDALTPLPGDRAVVVSGDAGFCVEEFCAWLNEKGFFLPLPNKGKRRRPFRQGGGLGE